MVSRFVLDCLVFNRDDRLLNGRTHDELHRAVKLHPKIISQVIHAQRSIFQAAVISLMYLDSYKPRIDRDISSQTTP